MAARSIKDVIAEGRLKRFLDRHLIKALSHPLREHALAVLNERVASASEIGREIDLAVPAFYHHVELLEELGCIERVETKRRRGAEEHFFRAKATMIFDEEAWGKVPASIRSDIAASHVHSVLGEVARAADSGVFAGHSATHNTWLPGIFDKLGWQEVMGLMNETLVRLLEIQKRSSGRVSITGERGIAGTVALFGFETSPLDPRNWRKAR